MSVTCCFLVIVCPDLTAKLSPAGDPVTSDNKSTVGF